MSDRVYVSILVVIALIVLSAATVYILYAGGLV